MTKILFLALCFTASIAVHGQGIQTLSFGNNTLSGKVILKTLTHPVKGTAIKNAMVLKLAKKVKFKAVAETDEDVTTDEIRIYGDVTKDVNPNIKYKILINRQVTITANIVYAPSGNYPLLANIIEDFTYKLK